MAHPTSSNLPLQVIDNDDPALAPQDVEIISETPNPYEVVENDDGSATVYLDEPEDGVISKDFDENLAELLEPSYLGTLGREMLDLVEEDLRAREKRDEIYEEGIRRTGLGNEAPGGASFQGASKVVHPMLAKGCVDFASRAIKELFPATGPCKTQIIGEQTEEKLDKAERKKTFMNWQSTTQVKENRAELEKLLSQVPLGGAQYKRWWWDPRLKRPRTEAVFIDNIVTPYGHADFYTSPRVAFRQMISRFTFEERVRNGLYRDVPYLAEATSMGDDTSKSQKATDRVVGSSGDDSLAYNQDGLRLVWQIEVTHEEPNDPLADGTAPYIMHVDASSSTVLGYFRNWEEGDEKFEKKQWMSEWPFIPWRDGPAVGLAHLIGSLSGAATGALRAILDSAHIANFPGAIALDGTGRSAGQSVTVQPTEIQTIKAPPNSDDIRKVVMPFPFPGPSPVLFQVMEWLTQQAEMVVATASEKIADAGNDMPVGTALALIEHGSVNFSAVHSRLHAALKRDLEILHRLNREHLEDEETIEELGELIVYRSDFEGPVDVIPVSDPNIFSEAQRYAQLQAIIQLKNDPAFAQYFKNDQLVARALKLLNVPDIEGIANLPKETKRLSPLDENYAISMQERPLKVYPEQDDLLHMKAHIQFATSPMFGANPLVASGVMPGLLQHCKEHLMALYRKHVKAAAHQAKLYARVMMGQEISDEEAQLHGAAFADMLLAKLLGPMVMPGMEKMQEIVQQIMQSQAPKPSPDIVLMEETKKAIAANDTAMRERVEMEKLKQKTQTEGGNLQDSELNRQSQERLASMATSIEFIRDQQKAGADMMKAEFNAQQQQSLLILQKILEAVTATGASPGNDPEGNPLPGQPPVVDPASLVTPQLLQMLQQTVVDSLTGNSNPLAGSIVGLSQQQMNLAQILQEQQRTNAAAFAQLAEGLNALNSRLPPPPQPQPGVQ